ncbi:MAG: hypothetical protein ACFFG0_05480 [Candidatus Thorarchaeota archaeon]
MLTEKQTEEYRTAAVKFIIAVWSHINWDNVGTNRRMRIYDELASKIKSAAMTNNLNKFLEKFMLKWGVRSVSDAKILKIIAEYDHNELLNILRNDTAIIILMLRESQELKKELREKNIEIGDQLSW